MQLDLAAALRTVMEFGLLLRRVTRLELKRRYGRKRLVEAPALYETIEPDLPHYRRLPPEHGTVGTDTKTLADVLGRKPPLRDLLNRLNGIP